MTPDRFALQRIETGEYLTYNAARGCGGYSTDPQQARVFASREDAETIRRYCAVRYVIARLPTTRRLVCA